MFRVTCLLLLALPLQAADFVISSYNHTGSNFSLTFPTKAGQVYGVERGCPRPGLDAPGDVLRHRQPDHVRGTPSPAGGVLSRQRLTQPAVATQSGATGANLERGE